MCRALSKSYLVLINSLTALLGLAIVGASTYVLIEYQDITAVLSKKATWVVLATGSVIFFVSVLGCCAARKQHRCGLFTYVLLLLAVTAAQLACGAVMAKYAGELKTDNGKINDLSEKVRDFVDCSRSWCCNDNGDSCPDTSVWNSNGFCSVLPDSLQSGSEACVADTADAYNQELVDFLHNHVKQFSAAAIAVGAVELLALFFALYLLCAEKPKTPEEIETQRRLNEQHRAGTLVYGSHPPAGQPVNYAV